MSISGCGFRPLYGPVSSQSDEHITSQEFLASIHIALITDRKGQMFRNELISLITPLGQPKNALYTLRADLTETSQALGILKDATFSVSQMTYRVNFELIESTTRQVVFKSSATVVTDYNVITDNEYATIVSAQNSQKRSLTLLAQEVFRELITFFQQKEQEVEQESLKSGDIPNNRHN